MRSFAFVEPESLQAATEILAKAGSKGRLLAGGIDLLGEMKDRLAEPETLVNLKSVKGLDSIRFEADGSLRIGALATLSDLAAHDRRTEVDDRDGGPVFVHAFNRLFTMFQRDG